jgi:hypothetical protein
MFECRRSFTLHLSHLHLSHPRHWPQKRTVAVPERVPTNLLCNTCPNRCRFHKVLYGLAKTQSASAGYATRSRCSLKTVSTSGASGIGFLLASVFIADPQLLLASGEFLKAHTRSTMAVISSACSALLPCWLAARKSRFRISSTGAPRDCFRICSMASASHNSPSGS